MKKLFSSPEAITTAVENFLKDFDVETEGTIRFVRHSLFSLSINVLVCTDESPIRETVNRFLLKRKKSVRDVAKEISDKLNVLNIPFREENQNNGFTFYLHREGDE